MPYTESTHGSDASLTRRYQRIRAHTESLCRPLQCDDYGVQSIVETSPPKWHLAHTTWFFETFLLLPYLAGYREFHPHYTVLFNSYYETLGSYHPRAERGLLARPTVAEIYEYRAYVDEHMSRLLQDPDKRIEERTTLGLHHEQQHQELLLTDIKHNFARNPLRPAYRGDLARIERTAPALSWLEFDAGIVDIGDDGAGFAYDNERPRHRVYVQGYRLASRPVVNGEMMEFIAAGGYTTPVWWLADGWTAAQESAWSAPLYWQRQDGDWWHLTLAGMRRVDEHAPVCHISYYEADAYARWCGARLPREAEWEHAAARAVPDGNLQNAGYLEPMPGTAGTGALQLFGDVWEWTASAYAPYPGYRPPSGALGEYNGKFMANQYVLRGGSCVTPADHMRASYRNFFHPHQRWQYSGLRLAGDAP